MGAATLVRSFPLKNRRKKRLARDVFDSFATHADVVHDVTDVHCWAQNVEAIRVEFL